MSKRRPPTGEIHSFGSFAFFILHFEFFIAGGRYVDVETFLRKQREAADSELRHVGNGQDPASRALRLPFEARAAIISWLVENRLSASSGLEQTLQAVSEQREAIPGIAPRVAANEAAYLLRRWRWFNPVK